MTSETADGNPEQIAPDESREILERITDAFFALDGQWRFTFVNERAEALLDQPRDALLGQTIWNAFPEVLDSTFEREYRTALETQEQRTFEAHYPPLERWFEVRAYPSESGLSVYFRDVSDRKEREEELERYETIVETVDDGVYVLDGEGRFVLVNDAYCQMTGYDRAELLGAPADLVVDEQTRAVAGRLEAELSSGERQQASLEAELQTADGGTLPAEATFAMLPGEDRHRVGVVRDVSDKRRREQRLEEQRDQLERLVDVNAAIQEVNRAIVGAESRDEVERTVCEHLVEAPEYEVAWVGELAASGEQVRPRTGAGVDEATVAELAAAEGSAPSPGPITNALRRQSVQVMQNVVDHPDDPRSELFDEQGYHSSISLPLVHGEAEYGDLTVVAGRRHAYSGTERELLEALADTVAYAVHTVEERGRYRSVVDEALDTAADVGVFVTDAEGEVAWTNQAAESYFGVKELALLDRERQAVLEEDVAPAVADPTAVHEQVRAPDEAGAVEYRVEADGERAARWVEHRSQPIETGLYAGGRVDLFYDITGRRQAVEELRRERDVTEQVLETSPVGILVATPDGIITRANDRAHELLGLEVDATGQPYTPGRWTVYDEDGEPIPPEDRLVSRALRTGEPVDREVEVEIDGGNIWLSARAVPITSDGAVERVVATAQDITALKERERQLRAQRDELERLDHLNAIIRDTLENVVAAESLEELQEEVCTQLSGADPYRVAWFADLDLATNAVEPSASAGGDDAVQQFLAVREAATEPGPVETAARTGTVQTITDVTAHPWFDAASEAVADTDTRSLAAVPVRYEDSQYGVLVVHADRPAAFDGEVETVLAELGDAIGLARNALVRRQGLLSDNVTRIELRLHDALPGPVAFENDAVTVEQTVSVGDGSLLLYLTGEVPPDVVDSAVEATEALGTVRLVDDEGDRYRYELEVTDPPLTETLVSHGGRLRSVAIDGRDYHAVAELPPQVDVRTMFRAVQERYPDVKLDAQRSVSRRESPLEHRENAFDRLTDRQREALETAYAAGYFDWPRDSSGEEVAEALEVSPSTFHQHLRVGERKVLDLLFDAD